MVYTQHTIHLKWAMPNNPEKYELFSAPWRAFLWPLHGFKSRKKDHTVFIMNISSQQQPNNAIIIATPSPTLTQNQQTISESHLVHSDNSTKVLLAMAVGLELGEGEIFRGKVTDNFPLAHRSNWKPTTSNFIEKIKRRKAILGNRIPQSSPTNIMWQKTYPSIILLRSVDRFKI